MALPNRPHWTAEDYLAFERDSDTKHEFIDGQPVAMSGASREHNLLVSAVVSALYTGLRGSPCEVYPSDMRVNVAASGLYTYPDVVVVCEEPVFTDDHVDTLTNPKLLVEVLSESTERYDRGAKFQSYRQLPSFREYLLVSQTEPRIERFLRADDDTWTLTDAYGRDAVLVLESIDVELKLAEVYERLNFGA
jgi:Uma2 family endonuclease